MQWNDTHKSGWNQRRWRFVKNISPEVAVRILSQSPTDEMKPLLARPHFDLAELGRRIPQVKMWTNFDADQYNGNAVCLVAGQKPPRHYYRRRETSKRLRPSTSSSQLTWFLYIGGTAKLLNRFQQRRTICSGCDVEGADTITTSLSTTPLGLVLR
jgi:hypothetical protein